MPDPITPQDLYGPSSSPPVEETPVVPMSHTPPPSPAHNGSFWSGLGMLIMFIGLFGIGMWLSSYLRQYVPNDLLNAETEETTTTSMPVVEITPAPIDPYLNWKPYDVISGKTKLAIVGLSYKLPSTVEAPTCDTTACMSYGTYLPGATRFTIAPRGADQLLVDTRGSQISDAGGVVFTTTDTTVAGFKARVFTGSASGKTVGGYGFSQIRGYMIEVSPTLTLELNHFTPNGVNADFAADDILFDQIVGSLTYLATSQ